MIKKGAKPFADIYRLNDKSEWTFKGLLSILIVMKALLFNSQIKRIFVIYIKGAKTYNKRLFTSESVTEGHPDKIADQVSDAILDEILKDDPNARVACGTTVTTGMALISGEISTSTYVDIPKVVRETIKNIGYTRAKYGYDFQTMAVLTAIDEQSPDIAQGVDKALEYRNEISEEEIEATGAGDQGLMFGYATNETDTYMPLPIFLSHQLAKRLSDVRKDEILDYYVLMEKYK